MIAHQTIPDTKRPPTLQGLTAIRFSYSNYDWSPPVAVRAARRTLEGRHSVPGQSVGPRHFLQSQPGKASLVLGRSEGAEVFKSDDVNYPAYQPAEFPVRALHCLSARRVHEDHNG